MRTWTLKIIYQPAINFCAHAHTKRRIIADAIASKQVNTKYLSKQVNKKFSELKNGNIGMITKVWRQEIQYTK